MVTIDSGLLSPVRAGTPIEAVVSDTAWLQAMLDTEAALARAQSRIGTVPEWAAEAITSAARAERLDLTALSVAARETANPVVGLVASLTRLVGAGNPDAAEFVHRGSTSQDIFDTATMVIAHHALRIIRADLARMADVLNDVARAHRDTPMIGRTLALHAVPTTFGLKAAGWRQLVLDADRRAGQVLDSLPVALGGAAGTLAGYLEYSGAVDRADYVDKLLDAFAAETGLVRPVLPWHVLRTPIADLAGVLAFTTGALGKIAIDVLLLTRTETGELAESTVPGRGSSSAMPHKRNPVLATLVRSAALQVPAIAAGLTQCLVSEDERSAGAWHAEWHLLRECLRLTGGATHTAVELVEGLEVRPERMRDNLGLTGSHVVSERIGAVLATRLGKAAAKKLISEAVTTADSTGQPLHRVLAGIPEFTGHIDADELAALCDPATYTGAADVLVDWATQRDH
nr:3-carboxy-cis,cis-muconate cycloisomerase [Kibdelosporangium phytohabitans]